MSTQLNHEQIVYFFFKETDFIEKGNICYNAPDLKDCSILYLNKNNRAAPAEANWAVQISLEVSKSGAQKFSSRVWKRAEWFLCQCTGDSTWECAIPWVGFLWCFRKLASGGGTLESLLPALGLSLWFWTSIGASNFEQRSSSIPHTRQPSVVPQYTKDHLNSIIFLPPDWPGNDTTQMILGIMVHRLHWLASCLAARVGLSSSSVKRKVTGAWHCYDVGRVRGIVFNAKYGCLSP